MDAIRMVDLRTQYEAVKTEINAEIQFVLDSGVYVKNGKTEEFCLHLQEYLGVRHVIPTGNGTDALQIALMALGLQPGDEVIVPAFTFAATVEVVCLLGLIPVFVDVDSRTFTLTADGVRNAITARTKAVIPVHLYGQNADMEALLAVANEYGLYVVEDACQSIGTRYTFTDGRIGRSGCMGNVGCTSFFPSKNLGCYGDGGALFTNDDSLACRLRSIANHGMSAPYRHDVVGINSRLDCIQAAVLDVKLRYLDEYLERRKMVAAFYDKALTGVPHIVCPIRQVQSEHTYHQYTLQVQGINRDILQAQLAGRGVPTMVYYPIPLHLQRAYDNGCYHVGDFPIAEQLSDTVLSLPMHTELSKEQQVYIVRNLIDLLAP